MDKLPTYLGVIEGFFGRAWSFSARRDYAGFLKQSGYQFYIYAPKSDPYLRKSWRQDWPADTDEQIKSLIGHYQSLGLDFGLGLSPFEIYKSYDAVSRVALQSKVQRLNALGIDILCLLFDDMRGDTPKLAQTQIEIVKDVIAQTSAKKVILCPTYYSFDLCLEKIFGKMPYHYLQDLGEGLPEHVDVFWTGPKVCSTSYPEAHMQTVTKLLGRKPFLWDNYPVNDGAKLSRRLHLKAFEGRGHQLAGSSAGHAVNPMNQAWLSRIALHTLPKSYALGEEYDPDEVLAQSLHYLCEKNLAQSILADIDGFQMRGLDALSKREKRQLIEKYRHFESPFAEEIVAWLEDETPFDPKCLTD